MHKENSAKRKFLHKNITKIKTTMKTKTIPFDKVLVRDDDSGEWCLALYAYYRESTKLHRMVGGACWGQCIPYEGNEHLLGRTEKPKED